MRSQRLQGFFDFVRQKGVVALAIGIVIGTAVTGVVNSLVNDIINPVVGIFLVVNNLEALTMQIGDATIGIGKFISTLIDFVIIAAVVYFGTKWLGLDQTRSKKSDSKNKN
jgi:large conductance mechanosensitive channel